MDLLLPTLSPRSSYTTSDLVDAVLGDLGYRNSRVITSGDIVRWAQRAQDQIAAQTYWFWTSDTINTVVGQAEYNLPLRSISITDVRYKSNALGITNISQLTQLNYNWRRLGPGTPINYYVIGASQIGLFPAPGSSGTTDVLVYYYALPPLVSAPQDQYYVPNGYEFLIETFAKLRASEKDARGEGQPRIPGYQAEWTRGLADLKHATSAAAESDTFAIGENALYKMNAGRPLFSIPIFTSVSAAT